MTWSYMHWWWWTLTKAQRRDCLRTYVADNPFATDEWLAKEFQVSIATIRLDRMSLGIPEVRERIRQVAAIHQDAVRSLEQREVVGEIVELHLSKFARSILQLQQSHSFSKTGIVRGHHLFAQVNSLAIAVMDADVVVTAKTDLKFHNIAYAGDVVQARVDVTSQQSGVTKCMVRSECQGKVILDGFIWVAVNHSHLSIIAE